MNTIVFVIPSLKTGGGNRVFFELANCLVSKYKIIIILPSNSSEGNTFYINEQITIIKVGKYTVNKIKKVVNIIKLYIYINKYHRQDKIIISDPIMCLLFNMIKNKANLYRFMQGDDYRIFDDKLLIKNNMLLIIYKYFCQVSYKQKAKLIFNSKFVYEQFIHDSGRSDVDCSIVYPALNHAIFYDKNMNIRKKELNICLVGRKHPCKGLQTFIDMYKNLDLSIRNKIHKIFIISHDDLSSFDIKDFILIKPKSDIEIADIYNISSIFISTSWWEGFGLPGLEAMACGCAVITSDSGGCHEYAINNQNALYFTPKSTDELHIVLLKLINGDELLINLVKQGKISAKAFSWEQSAIQLERIMFE